MPALGEVVARHRDAARVLALGAVVARRWDAANLGTYFLQYFATPIRSTILNPVSIYRSAGRLPCILAFARR